MIGVMAVEVMGTVVAVPAVVAAAVATVTEVAAAAAGGPRGMDSRVAGCLEGRGVVNYNHSVVFSGSSYGRRL